MDIWSFQKPLQKSQSMFMICSCDTFFGFLEAKISEIYEGELFTSLRHVDLGTCEGSLHSLFT